MFHIKLRDKILFLMLVVSVVPILIAGFLSVYGITVSHGIDVANFEDAVIDQKIGEIRSFFGEIIGAINARIGLEHAIYAESPSQKFLLSGLSQKFLLSSLLDANHSLEEAAFINLDGKETVRFNRTYPQGVADSELRDQGSLPGFVAAKAGHQYIGPVYYTLKGPMLTLALPVEDASGAVISVFSTELNLSKILQIVRGARIGKEGYLYLVDRNGFLIASGFKEAEPLADLKSVGMVGDVIGGKDFSGPAGQRRYDNYFGERVVAAGKFLKEFGWGLIAEWPVKEADASINDIVVKNLLVSFFVLLAVIAASVVLAILIVRPIRALEKGTGLVAQGKFDEPVNITTGDELEELGASFNKMMAGLKQLQELKDEFVFIAAHELRTPVAAMKGYLSLVLDGITGPITDKTKDFIQKVINSNNRLIQLVNDLLEVSRSEAGRLTIKVEPVDIAGPIKGTLGELKSLADKSGIELVYEPAAGLPKVLANGDRLKEVMVNLVGNSIKYMGGKGVVTVSHEIRDKTLVTHVKDNGLGMSKEAQVKLFEKFYRVQTEKTCEITGTGLGLFIVKEIIEKMNGKIWAESEGEEKGSTFSFSLPIAE